MLKRFFIFMLLFCFLWLFFGCESGVEKVHVLEFASKNVETDEWVMTELNESYLSSVDVGVTDFGTECCNVPLHS